MKKIKKMKKLLKKKQSKLQKNILLFGILLPVISVFLIEIKEILFK